LTDFQKPGQFRPKSLINPMRSRPYQNYWNLSP
jgi:hypothetical protein